MRDAEARSYWDEWRRISCPTLIVRGEHGIVAADDAKTMASEIPGARLVTIADAGHDLHLERPEEWRAAVSAFLDHVAQMPADVGREAEVADVIEKLISWATRRPAVMAVALVGSWARGTARMDSDLDVVVLSDDLKRHLTEDSWAAEIGGGAIVVTVQRGVLTERRVITRSGLEVEVGFATPCWASVPVDPGSVRVVTGGLRPLVDPHRLLERLSAAVSDRAFADRPPRE